MKKQFLAIAALAITSAATAQVGINNTTPTATLDITAKTPSGTTSSTNEGLLIPRVTRERVNSITTPVTSTMVYVDDVSTGNATGASVNIDAVGFYYYNGVAWTKMGAGAGASVTANNGLTLTSGNVQLGGALTQPTLISGLTATNNLAFTGTGNNAFSVDGNTFSVDASNHSIGIGTTAPNGRFEIAGTGGSDDDVYLTSSGTTGSFAASLFLRRSAGTPAAPAIVRNGDTIGEMNFDAYNGSSYMHVGKISSVVNGTPAAGSVLTDLFLSTGTSTPVERMRISSAGNVGIATNAPAATLDVAAKAATGTTAGVDGILIPRVTRQRAQSMTSVPVSTLVYITEATTGTQTTSTQFVDAAGFYYSDGTNWQKMGASATTAPLNVTTELDIDYPAQPTDDIILYNATAQRNLTLPVSGVAIGKKFYVSNTGTGGGLNILPASVVRSGRNSLNAGESATYMYIGGGKYDIFIGF